MKELLESIQRVRKEVGPMVKDQKVSFKQTKYKYFDINQMIEKMDPVLEKNGLFVIHKIEDGAVVTVVTNGEDKIVSSIPLHTDKPQDLGSEITYYRRYNLQAIFNLQAEDDDALRHREDYPKEWDEVGAKTPPKKAGSVAARRKEEMNPFHKNWDKVVSRVSSGAITLDDIRERYNIDEAAIQKLEDESGKLLL